MDGRCSQSARRARACVPKNVLLMLTVVAITFPVGDASCAIYGDTPPTAVIGEQLTLSCTLSQTCFSGKYEWFRIGTDSNSTLNQTSNQLILSENVTSADEFGGKLYECHCSSGSITDNADCKLFKIGVEPVVTLTIVNEVTKSGKSVEIICRAESYPLANKVINYKLTHLQFSDKQSTRIEPQLLSTKNGVNHTISSASKDHAGKYECIVSVSLGEYPDSILQSDIDDAYLTVYDPPMIASVHTYTVSYIPCVEQSALLECTVNNTDDDLQVWVNWTLNGGRIEREHIMLQQEDVFFLLLINVSIHDGGQYLCETFSDYSHEIAEDKKTLAVKIIDGENNTCKNSEKTPEYDLSQDCKCLYVFSCIWMAVLTLSAVSALISIVGLHLYQYRQKIATYMLSYNTKVKI